MDGEEEHAALVRTVGLQQNQNHNVNPGHETSRVQIRVLVLVLTGPMMVACQWNTENSRAELEQQLHQLNRTEQNPTEPVGFAQNRTEQNSTRQNRTIQNRPDPDRTSWTWTEQNRTEPYCLRRRARLSIGPEGLWTGPLAPAGTEPEPQVRGQRLTHEETRL